MTTGAVSLETAATSTAPADNWFRPDVDGLRAVAILLVVAFHAGITGFDGGFVGVDVFFVLSGWLITRNLLREADRQGRIDLPRFWARRIRRLMPALALVVVATSLAGALILPLVEMEDLTTDALAAALYVSNIVFADQSQGYFATDVSESPVLHTWSLGVEEQFYLFWPLIVGATVIAIRRPERLRPMLRVVFAMLAVGSFLISRRLTGDGNAWGFYGLHSRVWEFAAAGFLATTTIPHMLHHRAARWGLGAGGLACLLVAATSYSATTPYPGTAALLPVGGTLALIVAGDAVAAPTGIGRGLATAPMQTIGRLSYSWYLWHWPVVVLGQVLFDTESAVFGTLAVLASLPMAWAAYQFIENPVRFDWAFIRPTARTYLLGIGLMTLSAGVVLVTGELASAGGGSPIDEQVEEARSLDGRWPTCTPAESERGIAYCAGPEARSGGTVLLFGDSKAFGWYPTVEEIVTSRGGGVAASLFPSCPAVDVDVHLDSRIGGPDHIPKCRAWREGTAVLIEELEPDLVLVSQGSLYMAIGEIEVDGEIPDRQTQAAAWGTAFADLITEIRATGADVAVIVDNPAYEDDPNVCVARSGGTNGCERSRTESLERIAPLRAEELAVIERLGVAHIDLVETLCDATTCELGTRDFLHYFDSNHLSARSMTALRPEVETLIHAP